MAEGVSQVEAAGEEGCDESLPLSPDRVAVSVDTPAAEQAEGAAENLDEIDPFTYNPPFSLWHKIVVSGLMLKTGATYSSVATHFSLLDCHTQFCGHYICYTFVT